MDFNKSILLNKRAQKQPFLTSHRGINGSNIPCNTLLSYQIALMQGAEIVEIDVSKSKDGKYFVFHPGMEPVLLKTGKYLNEMTADEIKEIPILNCDEVATSYRIPTLDEVFTLLKDKVYINVDKYFTDIEGITEAIRRAGVEKQVIVKTYANEDSIERVAKVAPDFMFMTMVRKNDTTTKDLLKRGINFIGNEVLFETEEDEVIQDDYIKWLHDNDLLVWLNSILYNELDVISAGHTDDSAFAKGYEHGWGWLIDKGADIIQTDWLPIFKQYLATRK